MRTITEKKAAKEDVSSIINYLDSVKKVAFDISVEEIEKAIELLFEAWKRQSKVFIIGMGGSASTASHFACDLSKWTIVEGTRRFKVFSCTDNMPLVTGYANDEGLEAINKLLK